MAHREPFDPKRPLVAAREFLFAGVKYGPGDPFPGPGVDLASISRRHIERQYATFAVNHTDEISGSDAADDLIKMTGPKGGRYEITAPWLETPLTIRGKVNADKALAEMREEGAPLGWIDGGTEVEVEQIGDTLFRVSAPWLDDAEEIEGREAAEARQREIHQAGEPNPGADEGGEELGGDGNSDKSESEQGASGDAGDGSGTDGPDGSGDAQTAAKAAGNAKAGKSKADAPADA